MGDGQKDLSCSYPVTHSGEGEKEAWKQLFHYNVLDEAWGIK